MAPINGSEDMKEKVWLHQISYEDILYMSWSKYTEYGKNWTLYLI